MTTFVSILGLVMAVGIVYLAVLQRQMMENQQRQIETQQEIIRELQEVLKKLGP